MRGTWNGIIAILRSCMTSTVYGLSGYEFCHLWDKNLHPASWTVLSLRTEASSGGKGFQMQHGQGKWSPSNLREHSEVAWSTGERAENAHSLSAHREQDLQLHRWWSTRRPAHKGSKCLQSAGNRAESEASALDPLQNMPTALREPQHLILKEEPSRKTEKD